MSSFERLAIMRLLEKATAAGVEVPAELQGLFDRLECTSYPARIWAQEHPDEDRPPCCDGASIAAEYCTCWVAVYDVEQQPPQPLTGPQDLQPHPGMCGDCAFRARLARTVGGVWTEDALLALPGSGEAFWCHAGMRKPARWEHPDGRTVPGSPHDWRPASLGPIPYQADGSPAWLCAGWSALAAHGADRPVDAQRGRGRRRALTRRSGGVDV